VTRLFRQPLFYAFVIGCALSLIVSGRLTLRLIAGGALAWSFIPLLQGAAFFIVWRRGEMRIPFAAAFDMFMAGNRIWLVALIAFAGAVSFLSPLQVSALAARIEHPGEFAVAGMAVAVWSAWADFGFYRSVMERTAREAMRDLLLQRVLAWTPAIVYVTGYAGWPLVVYQFAR
jgi:hypothetical protein